MLSAGAAEVGGFQRAKGNGGIGDHRFTEQRPGIGVDTRGEVDREHEGAGRDVRALRTGARTRAEGGVEDEVVAPEPCRRFVPVDDVDVRPAVVEPRRGDAAVGAVEARPHDRADACAIATVRASAVR